MCCHQPLYSQHLSIHTTHTCQSIITYTCHRIQSQHTCLYSTTIRVPSHHAITRFTYNEISTCTCNLVMHDNTQGKGGLIALLSWPHSGVTHQRNVHAALKRYDNIVFITLLVPFIYQYSESIQYTLGVSLGSLI